jgi:uncharacterized protein (UPF0276 family)
MELAVNYSPPTAALLRAGRIAIDRFKCPSWPDLIATAQAQHPVYVHFPIQVGGGGGLARDSETGREPDWAACEQMLARTGTPLVNVHITASPRDYPGIPPATTDPAHTERLAEAAVRDLEAVTRRFGPKNVIAENAPDGHGSTLRPLLEPDFIRRVIEEAGCGLLLDLSHARRAADFLGMDVRRYIEALPVNRIGEIHVTGVYRVEGPLVEWAREKGLDEAALARAIGRLQDHLPMTGADWALLDWALERIAAGAWAAPWVVAFEYGMVGGFWERMIEEDVLLAQVPRLYAAVSVHRMR